jgi:hypothetical protein
MKGTTSGASAARLPSSHRPAHQRCRLRDERATMTDAPTRSLTLTPMPTSTLTPGRSSGWRRRTSWR